MSNFLLRIILYLMAAIPIAAQATNSAGLGKVARNLMEPVGLFGNFIDTGCLVLGLAFLFASLIKYFEHKRSPLMVPISTVVFLLIAGLVLTALPFLAYFTGN